MMQAIEELLALGDRHQRAGDLPRAEETYRRAVGIDPDRAEAWNPLGTLSIQRGELDEAIDCLRRATRLRPDAVGFRSNLAAALFRRGRLAEANMPDGSSPTARIDTATISREPSESWAGMRRLPPAFGRPSRSCRTSSMLTTTSPSLCS